MSISLTDDSQMDETYKESKMKKSKITKFSICKAHANVSLYKKPVQNSLELSYAYFRMTFGSLMLLKGQPKIINPLLYMSGKFLPS